MFNHIIFIICFLLIPFVSLLLLFFFEIRTWLYKKFFHVVFKTLRKSFCGFVHEDSIVFTIFAYFKSTRLGGFFFSSVFPSILSVFILISRPLKLMFTFWRVLLLLDFFFVTIGITTASLSATLCLASILTSTLWMFRNVYFSPNATPWAQFDAEARAYSIKENRFHVFDKELYDKKYKEIFYDYWEKKSTTEFMRKAYLQCGPEADAYWRRYHKPWRDVTKVDPDDPRFGIRYSIFYTPWENDPEDYPVHVLISLMSSLSVIVDTSRPDKETDSDDIEA